MVDWLVNGLDTAGKLKSLGVFAWIGTQWDARGKLKEAQPLLPPEPGAPKREC